MPRGRRVATSDDLEVSAYLEIAEGWASEAENEPQSINEGIIVIDFGSQYSHLIARRIRELKVYSEVFTASSTWETVRHINPKGVILSGGPASVYDPGAPRIPDWVFERDLPVSQYSHLIARRIRELKVYSEVFTASSTWETVRHINPKGVILSGGPASVYDPGAPRIPDWVFERDLPVLRQSPDKRRLLGRRW